MLRNKAMRMWVRKLGENFKNAHVRHLNNLVNFSVINFKYYDIYIRVYVTIRDGGKC